MFTSYPPHVINPRGFSKRKSESDFMDIPKSKRLLTEKIAADMGVLRLCDSPIPTSSDFSRPILQRAASTPNTFYHGHPTFIPSRPDLVSSFELSPPNSQDIEMPCDYSTSTSSPFVTSASFSTPANIPTSFSGTPSSSFATLTPYTSQPPQTPPINSQGTPLHMLNNTLNSTEGAIILVDMDDNPKPILYDPSPTSPSTTNDEEAASLPTYKLLIPKLRNPALEIPIIHNLIENQSRALILYTPPTKVIEDSIEKNKKNKNQDKNSCKKKEEVEVDSDIDIEDLCTPSSPTPLYNPEPEYDAMMLD